DSGSLGDGAPAPAKGLAHALQRGKGVHPWNGPLDRHTLAFRMATERRAPSILRAMRIGPPTTTVRLSPTARQLVRFCVVGASGYVINLAVYAALLAPGVHYPAAAAGSFLVAASSNYALNRQWTFDAK